MKIGILGGSFNPPHLGHVLVAQQVLEFTNLEKIWFLPCYRHTFEKPLAKVTDRVAMARLLNVDKTEVLTLEIEHRLDGNTINLVPILRHLFPNDQFTFIIGSDQLPTFTKWGRWEELLKKLSFLVVPRAGVEDEGLFPEMKRLFHPLLVTSNVSSTIIRQRITQGLSIKHLVPKEIEEYIMQHKLY